MEASSSCPSTPRWNLNRPFLTGRFHQILTFETKFASGLADSKDLALDKFSPASENPIGCYNASVQELLVIDDLLSTLIGIEGQYVSIKRIHGKEDCINFQESSKRMFPLGESYLLINQFVESKVPFQDWISKSCLCCSVKSTPPSAEEMEKQRAEAQRQAEEALTKYQQLESLIHLKEADVVARYKDYQAMVAQLEHQFRLGRLCTRIMVLLSANDGVNASFVNSDKEGFRK